MSYRRLWIAFAFVILGSFGVLGFFGREIYRLAPPIPERVVTSDGAVLFTGQDIKDGQNVWQSMGGQEVGSVWGHGAYVAPDWTADWLHRELTWLLNHWAGQPYEELAVEARATLKARLKQEIRTNTYQPATGDLVVSPSRAEAIAAVGAHYTALFGDDPALAKLRDAYAIPANTIKDPERQRKMNAFFWWASWACATERPGEAITYTQNWPSEELIDNRPSGKIVVWSVISFVLLLAGVGALSWYSAVEKHAELANGETIPEQDPLRALTPTPSMRATLKYFWVVTALIVVQVGLGAVTAHYGVEGNGFYGIPLAKWLPYAVTRTWHTQLGIFWIATAWLATGLFVAPAVSGYEPKFQRAGVNFLFVCLLIIVAGSMFGQWLGVQQKLGFVSNFWFGHQGYEYVDLGRFWQIFLFVGLFVWLALMSRALWPVLKKPGESRHLLALFLIASLAIAGFYGAGLMWDRQTHLAIAEYWRWWVVHLWVEGFFEVFATVVIAFLFVRMGLLMVRSATTAVLFSTVIFLSGGIIGTFHHLYFTGTPTSILALGATFSALEVVPLVLIGFEAYGNLKLSRARDWVAAYRWPIYFFVAVGFWNLVGAGLFGFFINPPIALYYMQGLNTTPVHGHTALFGVYGMLGIGLMLFCLRGLATQHTWRTGVLSFAFWAINIGLALMVLLSLLPIGFLQTMASVEHGMWYARSAEFLQTGFMDKLRWMRVVGDSIFAIGVVALGWFVVGLNRVVNEQGIEPVTAVAERPVVAPPSRARPPIPREHGAWGILLIPFATAVGVAGEWNLPVALLLVSILCFYVARTSYLKRNYRWTAILLAGSVVATLPLLFVWKLWWLAAFGAVAAPLAFRKTERSVPMQLLAVCGLTLTAPAAWYVATGELDYRLWLLHALYFAGGVFYVKMHITTAIARQPAGRWPVVAYYGALVGMLAWWPVGWAFVPVIGRAFVGAARVSPVLMIKRLGWTEVAHSLVFAALLVLTTQR